MSCEAYLYISKIIELLGPVKTFGAISPNKRDRCINFNFLSELQLLQEPSKRRAEDFLPVVLDDGTVSNDDLIKVPIKYPLHRRAHAPVICNGRPIKTRESAAGKAADNQ